MALSSEQSLINPMNLGDLLLVISILFVLARRHNLMPKKRLYGLVVPYGTCILINCELL